MTFDELASSVFPQGHAISDDGGLLTGHADLAGSRVDMIGLTRPLSLGIDEAMRLGWHVLDTIKRGGNTPILMLVDSDSQRVNRRDELLGLNQGSAHLAKCLMYAEVTGHRTVGLLYGHSAAGAFIATALAARVMLALPRRSPEVMDLPSMARAIKRPIDISQDKACLTTVSAPGFDHLVALGAIDAVLDPRRPLAAQIATWLERPLDQGDRRSARGRRGITAEATADLHYLPGRRLLKQGRG
jgi:malonate decarboxylase gamma subunit